MTETFIANLIAATVIVALLVAVCRIGFLTASNRSGDFADLEVEPAVSDLERRAA